MNSNTASRVPRTRFASRFWFRLIWLSVPLLLCWPRQAQAWLFFEHSRIAKDAILHLDEQSKALLQAVWTRARAKVPHYCPEVNSADGHFFQPIGDDGYCLEFSALTALSADHSCTPADTTSELDEAFVLDVLRVAEQTEVKLRAATSERERLDDWHSQHVELQIADPRYLIRAEGNGAHFQLASTAAENQEADQNALAEAKASADPKYKPTWSAGLTSYLRSALKDGAPMNAIGLYLNYHIAALKEARAATRDCTMTAAQLSCPDFDELRAALFANALEYEAFALHFLEDSFSAGHMLTHSGDSRTRMGTHDHYCEYGLPARTWDGRETYVAHGDAFMSPLSDVPHASRAVRSSLTELLAAFDPARDFSALDSAQPRPDHSVCTGSAQPAGLASAVTPATLSLIASALPLTVRPVIEPPGLNSTTEELGAFWMPNAQLAARVGLEDAQATNKDKFFTFARIPVRLRAGLGVGGTAGGVTNTRSDGVGWIEAHILADGRPPGSRVGIRLGGGLSYRAPYLVIPGDLIPLAVVALFSQEEYLKLAIRAAEGGVLGWQGKYRVFGTASFQFVLGREASFDWMPAPQRDHVNGSAISLRGSPGYWQLGLPLFSLTTVHVSEAKIGLEAGFELGYDLTRYVRDETDLGGAASGDVFHGLFLSYGYRGRHYWN